MTLAVQVQTTGSVDESTVDDSKDLFNDSSLNQTGGNINSADSSSELFG